MQIKSHTQISLNSHGRDMKYHGRFQARSLWEFWFLSVKKLEFLIGWSSYFWYIYHLCNSIVQLMMLFQRGKIYMQYLITAKHYTHANIYILSLLILQYMELTSHIRDFNSNQMSLVVLYQTLETESSLSETQIIWHVVTQRLTFGQGGPKGRR